MKRPHTYFTKRRHLPLGNRTYLFGILNLTPDSFSDGCDFAEPTAAARQFHRMVREGATVVDVGGESTRPGHTPISADEEIARVVPFIEKIRPHTEVLISVDTSKSVVAEATLSAGADIVNDVWGCSSDFEMAKVIAKHDASCVLMHNRSVEEAGCGDVVTAAFDFLEAARDRAVSAGVRKDAIALDPGLGFGKTYEENWEIMRRLDEFDKLGCPLLIGASRKSMIARLLGVKDPKARLAGTLGTTALAIQAGVDFIRVHDVRENKECADVVEFCLGRSRT